jgi:CheY-like chemotaxis protein
MSQAEPRLQEREAGRPDAGTHFGIQSTARAGTAGTERRMSTILVLDDEVRIGRLLTRALGAEGHAVDTAVEGLDGLALAKTGKYDLVLLDLRLPDIDGVSVLRRIMIARPQQPVFVMSAVGTPPASAVSSSEPSTTWPSHSTCRSSSCACGPGCGSRRRLPSDGSRARAG